MNIGGLFGALTPVFFVLALGYLAGKRNIAMPHPALQCPDIDAVSQVLCCESMTELVEKEMPAVRPLGAFVSVFGDALSAVQFGALGYALDDHVIFTVRDSLLNWETRVVKVPRSCVLGAFAAALSER